MYEEKMDKNGLGIMCANGALKNSHSHERSEIIVEI